MHRIKELREAKGLTQEAFGALLGVNQSTIASWESGKKSPTLANMVKIADALGVSLDEAMGRTAAS